MRSAFPPYVALVPSFGTPWARGRGRPGLQTVTDTGPQRSGNAVRAQRRSVRFPERRARARGRREI